MRGPCGDITMDKGPRTKDDSSDNVIRPKMLSPNHQLPKDARCLAIVPAFNESGSVGELVRRLHRALPGFDVVVIDDGSTDTTVHEVPEGAAIVSLPFNLGIGGAMQTGYRYAALNGYDVAVQV